MVAAIKAFPWPARPRAGHFLHVQEGPMANDIEASTAPVLCGMSLSKATETWTGASRRPT